MKLDGKHDGKESNVVLPIQEPSAPIQLRGTHHCISLGADNSGLVRSGAQTCQIPLSHVKDLHNRSNAQSHRTGVSCV